MLLVKLTALLRVIYFQYSYCPHLVGTLCFVCRLSHHGWNYCLEISPDGHQSMAVVLQLYFREGEGKVIVL